MHYIKNVDVLNVTSKLFQNIHQTLHFKLLKLNFQKQLHNNFDIILKFIFYVKKIFHKGNVCLNNFENK